MTKVAKYNIFKGVSTGLTLGTPIIALACCGDFFVHRSETAVSAAGMFAILLTLLFCKDKIVEHWKMPSAFVLSVVAFLLIVMIENILLPMKCVCIATMIASGVDELTFKRFYKDIELILPEEAQSFKRFGFLFTKEQTLSTIVKTNRGE